MKRHKRMQSCTFRVSAKDEDDHTEDIDSRHVNDETFIKTEDREKLDMLSESVLNSPRTERLEAKPVEVIMIRSDDGESDKSLNLQSEQNDNISEGNCESSIVGVQVIGQDGRIQS